MRARNVESLRQNPAARSELSDNHKGERKQEDEMLQARAREREQDRRAVQMQIDVVKKRQGITSFERKGPSII